MYISTVILGLALAGALREQSASHLTIYVSPTTVRVGQEVTLTESVPNTWGGKVFFIRHACWCIERYDPTSDKMIEVEDLVSPVFNTSDVMGGLDELNVDRRGFPLDLDEFDKKGIRFKFSPTTPGVYRVESVWHIGVWTGSLTCEPTKLTVLPRKTAKTP